MTADYKNRIPFNRPFIAGKELHYISQAVLGGKLAGNGQFTQLCQQWMQEKFKAHKVLLTHSCTAALEMSAILVGIEPGDEVIMPSFTFVSTANAFVLRGAKIRFVDIRPDTKNIDESKIEEAITAKTKAVVVVHYAGVGAEMDTIMAVAEKYNLAVIEDAAQGVDGYYKDRYLGTIGHLGAYSFHETKNLISGEGGAITINEPSFVERAEVIWEKGTNRTKFFRGEIDKYTWVDVGSSFLPSEIVAAFLYAQIEEADTINQKRRKIFNLYAEALEPLRKEGLVELPYCPEYCSHNGHMFYLILPDEGMRVRLIRHLKSRNIHSVFHYLPLHTSPMGKRISSRGVDLPVTDKVSQTLLRLPGYFGLTAEDQQRIISEVMAFFR